jgi:hypothetical protein
MLLKLHSLIPPLMLATQAQAFRVTSSTTTESFQAPIEASGESTPVAGAKDSINPPPPAKKTRALYTAPWAAEQALHRRRLNVPEATALGSLSPYFDPSIMAEGGFGHGNVSEAFGKMVRWQQIALGISVGVPLDEWDDDIHVKGDVFVPYGNVQSLEARNNERD